MGVTPYASARHVACAHGEAARGRPLPRAMRDEMSHLVEMSSLLQRGLAAVSSRRDETETVASRAADALMKTKYVRVSK